MLSPNNRALYVSDHGAHRIRHVVVDPTLFKAPPSVQHDTLDEVTLECLEGSAASAGNLLHFRVRCANWGPSLSAHISSVNI